MAGRVHARSIFDSGVRGAQPPAAVARALRRREVDGVLRDPRFRKIALTGQGKASVQMCASALAHFEEDVLSKVAGGLILTKKGHALQNEDLCSVLGRHGVQIREGGHPVPDEAGSNATAELLEMASGFDESTLVVNFVSGGGSALTSLPVIDSLSLESIQETTKALLSSGAPIEEVNAVRRHLSRFQGGKFAATCFPAACVSLIISDVIGDPIHVIAGGPTAPDPSAFEDCTKVVERIDGVPEEVKDFLNSDVSKDCFETLKKGDVKLSRALNFVISSNFDSLQACKKRSIELGYRVHILTSQMQGEAAEIGKFLAAVAKDAQDNTCILCGGETTVTLPLIGIQGIGGRNQELALSAALQLRNTTGATILCAGTDGQDGPCDATGAVVDGTTCSNPDSYSKAAKALQMHSSFDFFKETEAHIVTGPTGTNVMDLCVIIKRFPS